MRDRRKVLLATAFAAGLVLSIGLVARSQQKHLPTCAVGETSWVSFGDPIRTYESPEEAVAATLTSLDIKASIQEISQGVSSVNALEADAGPLTMVVKSESDDVAAVEVTIEKVPDGTFASGDARWCDTN